MILEVPLELYDSLRKRKYTTFIDSIRFDVSLVKKKNTNGQCNTKLDMELEPKMLRKSTKDMVQYDPSMCALVVFFLFFFFGTQL